MSGPIRVDPESCISTNHTLEKSAMNMTNLEESEETGTSTSLLQQGHFLIQDISSYIKWVAWEEGDVKEKIKSLKLKSSSYAISYFLE